MKRFLSRRIPHLLGAAIWIGFGLAFFNHAPGFATIYLVVGVLILLLPGPC